MNDVILTRLMYESREVRSKAPIMGLVDGQMRPYHRVSLADDVVRCNKLTHNSRWFNGKGQRLGYGDICACDVLRIAKEIVQDETFYILPESTFFNERMQGKSVQEEEPGARFCREKCSWFVRPSGAYNVYLGGNKREEKHPLFRYGHHEPEYYTAISRDLVSRYAGR